MTDPQQILQRITDILDLKVQEIEEGLDPLDLDSLLKIKAAFEKDQPVAFFVLLVINRMTLFLQTAYTPEHDTDIQTIAKFLQAFQTATEADLLQTMGSLSEGLALQG